MYPIILNSDQDITYHWMGQGLILKASVGVELAGLGSADLTGTAVPTNTEAQIVAGGRTVIITLTDDTWVADGATFEAERQGIIDGMVSDQSDPAGWNAVVVPGLAVEDVVRDSDTQVTITLGAAAGYDTLSTETITVTIPATALDGGVELEADSTFQVVADIPLTTASLTGTTVPNALPAEIVAGGETTIITLQNDTWVAGGATFDAQRAAIIAGITSGQSPPNGWNNEVRDNEVVGAVVRTSNTVVTITWSAAPAYDSPSNEPITVTIPADALETATAPVVASNTFLIGVAASAVSKRRRRWRRW
jgi:hypothetical protein